jgi:hypothetical protein
MTRRAALALLVFEELALLVGCAACARRETPVEVFPTGAAGWNRTSLREIPIANAPDPVPAANIRRIQSATYEGGGKLEAHAYELTGQEIGLDLAQKWRPAADTVFFWARNYFVVVKWQQADRKALQEFTRALEKRLNAQ